MKEPIKEQLLDNVCFFCRKLKLKDYFNNENTAASKSQHK